MTGTNAKTVHRGIAAYKVAIENTVESRCRTFCSALCQEAIKARWSAPGAHDYTGNLINSIVVCLYKRGVARDAWYASMYLKKAIRIKMRNRPRKKRYYFPVDYRGEKGTTFTPEEEAPIVEGRFGSADAKAFFSNYKPGGKNLFDIVVAYPVEYAEWIEMKRKTTGIIKTRFFAETVGFVYLKLEKV